MNKILLSVTFLALSFIGLYQERKLDSINFPKLKGNLPWSIEGGRIYINFGIDKAMHGCGEPNRGLSLKTTVGALVKCVANGEVAAVMDLDSTWVVMVKHGKYYTAYSKLAIVNVKQGDHVKSGTILGKVAPDSDGEGSLDFQIFNNNQVSLDPEKWLTMITSTKAVP